MPESNRLSSPAPLRNPQPPLPRYRFATGVGPLVLVLVVAFGVLILVGPMTNYGFSFVTIAPLSIGLALGTYVGNSRVSVGLLTAVIAVVTLVTASVLFGAAGVICAAILAVIVLVPLWIGIELVRWHNRKLERDGRSRPKRTTALLLMLSPLGTGLLEGGLSSDFGVQTVATSRVVAASPQQSWEALVFFEDVTLKPPLLTRVGLPRPLRTDGEIKAIGDIKICTYDSGHLTKQITAFRPGQLLRFEVIEQEGIEDRSIDLLSGSFRFEPEAPHRTKITLTTTYQPLLAARFAWQPFERLLATALHEHVLDGIEWRLSEMATTVPRTE